MNEWTEASLVGRTIAGKFFIESPIGRGAMGVVYRARQTALDKVVAIKVMHPESARDAVNAALFQREAKAASRLDHPNSVRVVDFGQDPDGPLYIAMEYFAARDLHDILVEDWPLPGPRVADILSQALAAIGAAHDLGVVHRDLKPENILVQQRADDEGAAQDLVKVCDFGIAKFTEPGDPALSREGAGVTQGLVIGTPHYMSPEQGQGENLDARTDIYSMGVILYQMLTSRVPFEGASAVDVIIKQVRDEPEPPTRIAPWVDPRLEAVCVKAMRKRRNERYQSAREMRADLRAVLAAPLPAPDVPRPVSKSAPTLPPAEDAAGAAVQELEDAAGAAVPELAISPPKKRPPMAARAVLGTAIVTVGGAIALLTRLSHSRAPADMAPPPTTAAAAASPTHAPVSPAESKDLRETPLAPAPPPRVVAASDSARPRAKGGAGPKAAASPLEPAGRASASPPEPPTPPSPGPADSGSSAPAPAPSQAKPPISAPASFDPSHARVTWLVVATGGGASANEVRRALGRVSTVWDECYENALRVGSERADGSGVLHIVTDEEGNVVQAHLAGFTLPTLGPCIANAAGVRIGGVDTGSGWADLKLAFHSGPSE